MNPHSALTLADMQVPTKEDMLGLMADLRIAYENEPTLERGWMVEMSKYIFHVVGEWQRVVTDKNQELEEKVDHLENTIRGIYQEMRDRAANQEQSVRLCLSVANRFFPQSAETSIEKSTKKGL